MYRLAEQWNADKGWKGNNLVGRYISSFTDYFSLLVHLLLGNAIQILLSFFAVRSELVGLVLKYGLPLVPRLFISAPLLTVMSPYLSPIV